MGWERLGERGNKYCIYRVLNSTRPCLGIFRHQSGTTVMCRGRTSCHAIYRASALRGNIIVSVCPSVCSSPCDKILTKRPTFMRFSPNGSPKTSLRRCKGNSQGISSSETISKETPNISKQETLV